MNPNLLSPCRTGLWLLLWAAWAALPAQPLLRGVVVDKTTGAPIRGANVSVANSVYGTMTSHTGQFALAGNLQLPAKLVISRTGYASQTLGVAGADQQLAVALVREGSPNRAAGLSAPEYQLKLAFLEKFIDMTSGPAGPDSAALVVGIYGRNPFGDDLLALEGKRLRGRPVRVAFMADLAEAKPPDVLFVPKLPRSELARVAAALAGKPTLVVSDEGVCGDETGVMVGFVQVEDKLRFCVNAEAMARAGIVPDPVLVAMSVR